MPYWNYLAPPKSTMLCFQKLKYKSQLMNDTLLNLSFIWIPNLS